MNDDSYGIGELADAAGLSRRAVRFYVQRELLPPPDGRGRGARYTAEHLRRLQRIRELQDTGHSLEEIRAILAGKGQAQPKSPPRAAALLGAETWLRVELLPGVELQFDPARAPLGAADLKEIQELALRRLGREAGSCEPNSDSQG
ncbi:MAG: MerR family transcriptional regulator [Planctomycetota bacterium]|nr:MAG: MerR family transcriptional regulator [Planctomycetota bacterium]